MRQIFSTNFWHPIVYKLIDEQTAGTTTLSVPDSAKYLSDISNGRIYSSTSALNFVRSTTLPNSSASGSLAYKKPGVNFWVNPFLFRVSSDIKFAPLASDIGTAGNELVGFECSVFFSRSDSNYSGSLDFFLGTSLIKVTFKTNGLGVTGTLPSGTTDIGGTAVGGGITLLKLRVFKDSSDILYMKIWAENTVGGVASRSYKSDAAVGTLGSNSNLGDFGVLVAHGYTQGDASNFTYHAVTADDAVAFAAGWATDKLVDDFLPERYNTFIPKQTNDTVPVATFTTEGGTGWSGEPSGAPLDNLTDGTDNTYATTSGANVIGMNLGANTISGINPSFRITHKSGENLPAILTPTMKKVILHRVADDDGEPVDINIEGTSPVTKTLSLPAGISGTAVGEFNQADLATAGITASSANTKITFNRDV
jgi:hypothetical protein